MKYHSTLYSKLHWAIEEALAASSRLEKALDSLYEAQRLLIGDPDITDYYLNSVERCSMVTAQISTSVNELEKIKYFLNSQSEMADATTIVIKSLANGVRNDKP